MKSILRLLVAASLLCMLLFPSVRASEAIPVDTKSGGIVRLSSDIYVNEGNTVEGDVVTVSGNIYINGTVTGSAVSVLGNIYINGEVQGDAVSVFGNINVGEKGRVLGDTVEALDGAAGNRPNFRNYNRPRINVFPWSMAGNIIFSLFTSIGVFLIAALVYLIMPRKVEEMAGSIETDFGRKLGIGILTMIGSPIAMIILSILLIITIIGIIVVPFAWIAYFIAVFIGVVPVYVFLGRRVASAVSRPVMSGYGALAAGIFTLWLIRAAASFGGFYTGWIGWIISFAIYVIGIGTLLDYIFSNRSRRPQYNPYPPYPPYPPQGGGYGPSQNEGNGPENDNGRSNDENRQ